MNSFTSHVITLSGAQLSDLFFNHEHPNLEALYKRYENQKVSPSQEELEQATLLDATEFIALYGIPVLAQDLADDFSARV